MMIMCSQNLVRKEYYEIDHFHELDFSEIEYKQHRDFAMFPSME